MANNRMYLRCPECPGSKSVMLSKYYPTTGWYLWGDDPEIRINDFFEAHRHDSQWGNGFVLEFESEPDFPMESPVKFAVSEIEPFPLIEKPEKP